MEKAKVYFSKEITAESVVALYKKLGVNLEGKVAVKVHSGEVGNQNFIRPEFFEKIIGEVDGTVVECNTAYEGARNTTEKHKKAMEQHGWSKYFAVDILDETGDMELAIKNGKHLTTNYVGNNMKNYDSMLVLSHFKGHPMGGFGGAIKNISIGLASSYGKAVIHGAGNPKEKWTAEKSQICVNIREKTEDKIERITNIALRRLEDVLTGENVRTNDLVTAIGKAIEISGLKSQKHEIENKGINIVVADKEHQKMLEDL